MKLNGASAKSFIFGTAKNFRRKSLASLKFVLSVQLCEWQPSLRGVVPIFTLSKGIIYNSVTIQKP